MTLSTRNRNHRRWGTLGGVVVSLVLPAVLPYATAHPIDSWGEFTLFQNRTLAQALREARAQASVVFIYVPAPGQSAPAYLETPEPRYWLLSKLLVEETVALKLEVRSNTNALAPYRLSEYPVMLLLNPDGSERRRTVGDKSPEHLQRWLEEDLSGKDTIARLRQAIARAEETDPLLRQRLGDALVRCGKFAEGLAEYSWCVEVGLVEHRAYVRRHRDVLLAGIAELGKRYPPALAALRNFQKAMAQTILAEPNNHTMATNLAILNARIGDRAHTLAMFDKLPIKSRARHTLFDHVFEELVKRRRYDEAVYTPKPGHLYKASTDLGVRDVRRAFRREVIAVQLGRAPRLEDPNASLDRGVRAFAIRRGLLLVEALAGLGRTDEALELARKVTDFDNTPETRALLIQHAERAGCTALRTALDEEPPRP